MLIYAIRRVLWTIPVLWFVATVTFFLMHAIPGGPFDSETTRSAATAANLEAQYGLDEPLPRQYVRFMANLAQGDLGSSFQFQDRPVREVIGDGLWTTATLGGLAAIYAFSIGVTLGVVAAVKRNGPFDWLSVLVATAGAAVPSFVVGVFLVSIFSLELGWTPVYGWGDWRHAVLPVIALGGVSTALIARVTRASVIEVLGQEYVRTARAKGLSERTVVMRHVLRSALLPVITLAGPVTASLVTGSFIIEQFFGIPGIGRAFVEAVFARDYGMIMGTTLFYGVVVAGANLLVDLLYGVVDPRMRSRA